MVSASDSRPSFWNDEDLFKPLLCTFTDRFETEIEAVSSFLKPRSMSELCTCFAEVLHFHTPKKITAKRWEKLLWADLEARKQIKQIHLKEIGELQSKQRVLRSTAKHLIDAFRRCLNGTYGDKVKEELEASTPALLFTEGLLKLLCIDAIFQKQALASRDVFSKVAPKDLQNVRRSLRELDASNIETLLIGNDTRQSLQNVVTQASKRLSDLDLSRERMQQAKRLLIERLIKKHLSAQEIARCVPRYSQRGLDLAIQELGRCPQEVDLLKPSTASLSSLCGMMLSESEVNLSDKSDILLWTRAPQEALDFAATLTQPESRELYLQVLVVNMLVSGDPKKEILQGALNYLADKKKEFIKNVAKRLSAEQKELLAKLINQSVKTRHLKAELLTAAS